MPPSAFGRAITGLAAGAVSTAGLLVAMVLGALVGFPFLPFTVFEWLIRMLPGPVVTFGLDLTLRVLGGLGLDIKDTAKAAEEVLAVGSLFCLGLVVGLLFFVVVRAGGRRRISLYGVATGMVLGVFFTVVSAVQGGPVSVLGQVGFFLETLVLFGLWGWALARLRIMTIPEERARQVTPSPDGGRTTQRSGSTGEEAAVPEIPGTGPAAVGQARPQAEVEVVSRRRFIVRMGGLAATILVVGAGLGDVIRAETTRGTPVPANQPVSLPNAGSPVVPAPGTRPEYTPVADFYRVDIDLTSPDVDPLTWRLAVEGLVGKRLSLTLEELKSRYRTVEQFITLSCISNPLGGPLIGTTLWSGVPLRDVLADAEPGADARYAQLSTADGFYEEVDLDLARSDQRVALVYAWDRKPLTRQHGFPLRIFVPDRYGMKQPKWITGVRLTAQSIPGYWPERGWDANAYVKMTSVIDTVAIKSLVVRNGQTYIPIGGIAYSGAKGISRVEIQIDDLSWEAAELRQPLSELTWVIWRYDWPFSPGTHRLTVRAFDGEGRPQETKEMPPSPSGATGLYSENRTIAAQP